MQIRENKLSPDPTGAIKVVDKTQEVTRQRGWRPTIRPLLLVIHYAVTDTLDATYRAQKLRGFFAHLSVDGFRDGERSEMRIIQQVPFDVRGAHAGESSWEGLDQCNDFSIGIEIANPGPLLEQPDGSLQTVYGKTWPREQSFESGAIEGYPPDWKYWAVYTDEEASLIATVALALKETYPLQGIVGHSEIAPGRKFDPGPAFPLRWLQRMVFGSKH